MPQYVKYNILIIGMTIVGAQIDQLAPCATYMCDSRRSGQSRYEGPGAEGVEIAWAQSFSNVGGGVYNSVALDAHATMFVFLTSQNGDSYAINSSALASSSKTRSAYLWYKATIGIPYGTPALGGNGLLYATQGTKVVAINHTESALVSVVTQIWIFSSLYSFFGSVAIGNSAVGGLVYVGDSSGVLYALHPLSGEVVWSFATQSYMTDTASISTAAAVSDLHQKIYFLSNTVLWALNAVSGSYVWGMRLGGASSSAPSLSVDELTVFIGAGINAVMAFDALNGNILWQSSTRGPCVTTPTVGNNGLLYAICNDVSMSISLFSLSHAFHSSSHSRRYQLAYCS